jgi:hypothetical protein
MKKEPYIASAIAAVVFYASVIITAPSLPARVASHFNGANQADGWMERQGYVTFMLAFGTLLPAFLTFVFWVVKFAGPNSFNVPNPEYWRSPENFPRATKFMFNHSFWFLAVLWIFLAGMNYSVVQAQQSNPPVLSPTWTLLLMGYFFAALVVWIVSMLKFYKNV